MPPQQPTWLTREEAAEYARVSPKTISRAVAAGELHGERVRGNPNGRLRFRRAWLDAWLAGARPLFVLALALVIALCLLEVLDLVIPAGDFFDFVRDANAGVG